MGDPATTPTPHSTDAPQPVATVTGGSVAAGAGTPPTGPEYGIADPGAHFPVARRQVPRFGPYARWLRRVVATLLDGTILTAVTFLAVGPVAGPSALPIFLPGESLPAQSVDGATWQGSGWVIGTLVALVLLQAYTGTTPGKRAMGISVIGRDSGRPVGIVTTVLRWLAHFLDAILCIGYLRPLWEPERRTFADSLASTIVVRSRYPLPWSPGATAAKTWPGPQHRVAWWDRSVGRARTITTTAVVLCLVGVGFSVSETTGAVPFSAVSSCTVAQVAPFPSRSEGLTGFGASMDVAGRGEVTRLGISRPAPPPAGSTSIAVYLAGSSERDVEVEASILRADGTPAWTAREAFGSLSTGVTSPSQLSSLSVPDDVAAGLGTSWTWEVRLLVDGVVVEACTGEAPVQG